MLPRRLVLAAAGGLPLALAGRRLAAADAGTAAPDPVAPAPVAPDPVAPWAEARAAAHPDWRVRAASWAVLAPNPHNRQPWLLDLEGADAAVLRVDLTRLLPVTDPVDRQVTVGLGCFLELFRMAAAEEGIALEIARFPEGVPEGRLDARPVARIVRLAGAAAADPLFAWAPARRSAKRPYDMGRPVGAAALAGLREAALSGAVGPSGVACDATEEPGRVAALRDLMARSGLIEATTPETHGESVRLMRFGRAAVAANPDGIPLWGPGVEEAVASGALSRRSVASPDAPAFAPYIERYRALIEATPACLWIVTPGGTGADALAAGRAWLRVNLAATGMGLGVHPMSQALQEFPAMRGPFEEAHRMLGAPLGAPLGEAGGARVQMLARVGYVPGAAGMTVPPTPRWPAGTRIRGA